MYHAQKTCHVSFDCALCFRQRISRSSSGHGLWTSIGHRCLLTLYIPEHDDRRTKYVGQIDNDKVLLTY